MMSDSRRILGIVVLVAIILTAFAVVRWRRPEPVRTILQKEKDWHYDLGTGRLFTGPAVSIPPIDAPSGKNQGVRAYVFACGQCPQAELIMGKTREELLEVGAFIGWLEMHTEEAKQAMIEPEGNYDPEIGQLMAQQREEGHLVRGPDDPQWTKIELRLSELQTAVRERCGPNQAVPCRPEN